MFPWDSPRKISVYVCVCVCMREMHGEKNGRDGILLFGIVRENR